MKQLIFTGAILAALTSPLAIAADVQPQPMPAAQQKQIEDVVHNYLVKNPEVIMEAVQSLQKKQMEQAKKTMEVTQANSPKFADAIFHQSDDPVAGNPQGKVTVVDFFDYQCPHCTRMTPVIDALLKSNNNVRFVFKEFPIRGKNSEFASKAALAANMQGKYFELHKALMQASALGELNEDAVIKAAQSVPGLNVDKMKTDMNSDVIAKKIKSNYKLAQDLKLMGTPAFFIAKSDVKQNAKPTEITFVPGQIDQPELEAIIKKLS